MNELSLFSGYSGFSLGLKLAIPNTRTIGYVEWEKYPQKIIAARIKEGFLDEAPIFGDIRAFNSEGYAESYQGMVDIITGGWPCQPWSVAGKQKGTEDERDMWPETIKAIRLVRPRFFIGENVPGLLGHKYYGRILGELSEAGYDAEWQVISAAECGANHKRKRLWIVAWNTNSPNILKGAVGKVEKREDPQPPGVCANVADSDSMWEPQPQGTKQNQRGRTCNGGENVADSDIKGLPEFKGSSQDAGESGNGTTGCSSWWETEPPLGRVVDGCPNRVGQLKALGNGIVPAVVAEFLRRIT